MSKFTTHDVIAIDSEYDTWGSPGTVIRVPDNVKAKWQDDWDNGDIKEIAQDEGTTLLDVEQLVDLFDYCKKLKVKGRRLRELLRRTEFQAGRPIPAGEARPSRSSR